MKPRLGWGPMAPPGSPFERFAKPCDGASVQGASPWVASAEVVRRLQGLARGWDAELEGLLSLPRELYATGSGQSQYYSSDPTASIGKVLLHLMHGAAPDVSAFSCGIALHERAGTLYFVLGDPARRIIVRERIACYHHSPPELEWTAVKGAIRSALAGAGEDDARRAKLFAVYDGSLRLVSATETRRPGPGGFPPLVPLKVK